ncbi:Zinc transporter, ZIP family [hydrothermal vent metagenome]|uniref:Zinc transporter, ZIP family n=1 Tax=hydrothermal vent metagenome TaxID=652676 RepID=A0A3B1BAK8_9ZZZZ
MNLLVWIILFSLLGGVLSVLVASVYLFLPDVLRQRLLPHLISFAIGALLGAAFLAVLPHAMMLSQDFHGLGLTILLGILFFFSLEKMVLWRHCHAQDCEAHSHSEPSNTNVTPGLLILLGDGLHNMVDGVLIASAFLTDFHLGVVTSLAIAAHEIPQEVGDFAVLLHSGFSSRRALLFNILSSLTSIIGAVVAYYSFENAQFLLPYVLAVAASSFIYIAVADLIPGLHKRTHFSATVQQLSLILLGVAVIYWAHIALH